MATCLRLQEFLEITAFYSSYPVPRHIVEKKDADGNYIEGAYVDDWFTPEKIVSNGPFRLHEWRVNEKIRLHKSETYWNKDAIKLNVIDAVLSAGYPGLAVLMVIAAVVGAFYYLRVIWYMYFEPAEDQAVLQASADTRLVLSLNGAAVLALGIAPGWLWALCTAVLAAS